MRAGARGAGEGQNSDTGSIVRRGTPWALESVDQRLNEQISYENIEDYITTRRKHTTTSSDSVAVYHGLHV